MKRGIALSIIGFATIIALIAGSAPASALSLFGYSVTAASQQNTTSAQPAGNAISALMSDAGQEITNSCRQYADHQYEVCFAYIFNSSLTDLVPYYKFVHDSNGTIARGVSYRLGSRYTGQAEQEITNRVASWPTGNLEVSTPCIQILAVHSDLTNNTAILHTVESWHVTTQSGQVVYSETNTPYIITMQRVPSYVLHKWVVTSIY